MSDIKPVIEKKQLSNGFIHENPLVNKIFRNRGLKDAGEIEYKIEKRLPPSLMKGMSAGTDLIIKHIMADSKIIIVGDYDCDGATATTIAVEGLRLCGAKNVDFIVPDRVEHGYGLSRAIVELVGKENPDLIITVDNGIASFDGVQAVRDLKHPCEILVTDHHLPVDSGEVPDADAIINPNQPGCKFPSKNIAGCGVMFYTIAGLRAKMKEQGYFEKLGIESPNIACLFDVLALGTVADVVTLDFNNRLLINKGLELINAAVRDEGGHAARGFLRPGLRHLLEKKGKTIGKIVAQDFGFAAGPCLNAAGRLEDMSLGIRCLLEKNETIAEEMAQKLVDLNEQRKEIEGEMVSEALDLVGEIDTSKDGLCVYEGHWHEGVVGIVASRIKDRTNRPIICWTDTHELAKVKEIIAEAKASGATEEEIKELEEQRDQCDIKGSARSIKGVHLKHALDHIFKSTPEVMLASGGNAKFGGHAMAAGISIQYGNYEKFQQLFDKEIKKQMTQEMRIGALEVDIKDVPAQYLSVENADLINSLGPWGQNFEYPVFSKKMKVVKLRPVGEKKNHLQVELILPETGEIIKGISFNSVDKGVLPAALNNEIEVVFKIDVNEWRGNRNLQLMVEFLQDEQLILSRKMEGDSKQDEAGPPIVQNGAEALATLQKNMKSTSQTSAPIKKVSVSMGQELDF